MPSLADRKRVYENYLSAINEKALSFYEENLENKYHDVTLVKDQLRASYEKRIVNPDYSVQLLEYLPVNTDDCIRARLKTSDGDQLDITYFFSKENAERFIYKLTDPK